MTNVDELDRIWRDGLHTAAEDLAAIGDVRSRVAVRVRHRRRSRRAASVGVVAVLAASAAVGVAELHDGAGHGRVATQTPAAVVQIDDAPGGALRIDFPGRELTGSPPAIALPSGLIRFQIHDNSPGHDLRIDGVSGFDVGLYAQGETITKDVNLAPGEYAIYCAIPGHRAAGEEVRILVH